ncbi:unnamed protein product [Medioppia subpectinata]|uniref:Uncharacterized protein n=1 Tax=Medioppia subpectinata TaxID=1979941 RepID=A0A7R9Q0L9_9ACAR|nr:unnamed protein product [Medioppia subpectinata]CAG2107467.1 unnamed protein product [Medioppia subpectinata]
MVVDPLNRLTCMYGRLLLFKIESHWDWNKWYDSSCLINNPFYETKRLRERDCHLCEDITRIERNSDLKSGIIGENFIRNEIPLIVGSDQMESEIDKWPIAGHQYMTKMIGKIKANEEILHKTRNTAFNAGDDKI